MSEFELECGSWCTCGWRRPSFLDEDSVWRQGPEFLALPIVLLNFLMYYTQGRGNNLCVVTKNKSIVNVNRFGDYNKQLSVTAIVLNTVYNKSLLKLAGTISKIGPIFVKDTVKRIIYF